MEFKDRLKISRTTKSFSQAELSKLITVHITNISHYERGENKPDFKADIQQKLA